MQRQPSNSARQTGGTRRAGRASRAKTIADAKITRRGGKTLTLTKLIPPPPKKKAHLSFNTRTHCSSPQHRGCVSAGTARRRRCSIVLAPWTLPCNIFDSVQFSSPKINAHTQDTRRVDTKAEHSANIPFPRLGHRGLATSTPCAGGPETANVPARYAHFSWHQRGEEYAQRHTLTCG